MSDKSDLRDALLKQDGPATGASFEIPERVLARDQKRVRRMKWIAWSSWAIFLIVFVLAAVVQYGMIHRIPILGMDTNQVERLLPEYSWFLPLEIIIVQGLFMLAVAMTFRLHVRWRTLTMHQIQASLASIEEQLRKMGEQRS